MWAARFLLFILAQAIATGRLNRFLDHVTEFLASRTAARTHGLFLSPAANPHNSTRGSDSSSISSSSSAGGLSSIFFGHPHATVHSFSDEESFLSQLSLKGGGSDGAPWLIHLFSPHDEQAAALNLLLKDEVAPILYLSHLSSAITEGEGTAPAAVKLHIGKIDVVAQPHLAMSLGWVEEGEADDLAPHRSLLKIVRTPEQQQMVEEYHGRRTRHALLELAEHASSPGSFWASSLDAFINPPHLRSHEELAGFRAEHPFVFVLVEREQEQAQDKMVRLAFVSTCEARMWRHCAVVGHGVLDAAATAGDAPVVVAKLDEHGADPVAFARRPESLQEWLESNNYPLVASMPLALEGAAFDRLLRNGGRLVVARVRGGAQAQAQEGEEDKALVERLHAVGRTQAAWLRQSKTRLGFVVEDGPRTQLALGAAGDGASSVLTRLFVVDGPTRGVYNVEDPSALESVLQGIAEGRMAVPTFPLVRKGDRLGQYPHVAKLVGQVQALVLAVAAALALAMALGVVVLLSPRRWWVGEAAAEKNGQAAAKRKEHPHQPHRLLGKFSSGDGVSASITGA